MEYEFIKDKVDLQKRETKYRPIIEEWLKTENKTLRFKCKSTEDMRKCYAGCSAYKKKVKGDYTIFQRSGTCEVYLVRA